MIDVMFIEILKHKILEGFEYLDDSIRNKVYSLRDQNQNNPSTEWLCDTFNTLDLFDLSKDDQFRPLMAHIANEVGEFSKEYGIIEPNVQYQNSWINLAPPGEYQEFHIHTQSHFSIVYYIDLPPNSGRINFRSHLGMFDMFDLKETKLTRASYKTYYYDAVPHELLIFRSYLNHMVEKNRSNKDRISISANLVVTDNAK